MKSLLIEGLDLTTVDLRLANFEPDEFGLNRVHLHTLVPKTKGAGRKAMEAICKNADALDITISLNACPLRTDLYQKPLETSILVRWYEQFRFKITKPYIAVDVTCLYPSHNSPFWLHMSHLLIRTPQH